MLLTLVTDGHFLTLYGYLGYLFCYYIAICILNSSYCVYFVNFSYTYLVNIYRTIVLKKIVSMSVINFLNVYFAIIRNFLNKRHVIIMKEYLSNSMFILVSFSFVFRFVKNKQLKLGFLNPGSLGTRHEEFLVALESRSVDIMAINETWLRHGEELRAPFRLRHTYP